MEKITTFVCAINFTCLPNISLFCLRITYTQGKFHPSKSLYIKYLQKIKHKPTYKTGQHLKKSIPTLSEKCISSGFAKKRFDYFQSIKIFNFIEKSIFLRFLHEDADKVTKQNRDKHEGLNPCYFVN